jgi:hypothetical protein
MTSVPITVFTWGYWGWGNAVPRFLEAAASAEAARGFDPPAFADVRLSRSVRAPGFRGGALGTFVGADRYRWFEGLGNSKIATHEVGVQIANPGDASLLLDYVVMQAASKRRVLFFCACPVNQPEPCHRHEVATLLLHSARARDLDLTVVEWPGGDPENRELRLRADKVKGAGRTTVPLGKRLPQDGFATFPWGSIVRVRLGNEVYEIVTGPAIFKTEWVLPVLDVARPDDPPGGSLTERARDLRAQFKCDARCS